MTDPSEVARQVAARRRAVPGMCAECGGGRLTGLKKRRLCSDLCAGPYHKPAW